MLAVSCGGPEVTFINNRTSIVTAKRGTILLPCQDDAPEALVSIVRDDSIVGVPWTARLAVEQVDYVIPFNVGRESALKIENLSVESSFYDNISSSRVTRKQKRELRPVFHLSPEYGWMNDPNGMVYHDGEYHLFYQYNPLGARWGNMSWGHAVSYNLVDWDILPVAMVPDSLGMIFSGSAVVDSDNTSGFGQDAIVAIYTSAGERQSQSIAYSLDKGRTFVKYAGNPVLTSNRADFRDPKVSRVKDKWIMTLAAGNGVEFYSSDNLKEWDFESHFGEGIGCHNGVWECPDLFELPYGDASKWVLLVSCNRSDVLGSGTQYFIGDFDGHEFVPDDSMVRWLDQGRDNYAGVTWFAAPDGRRIFVGWENNWQYGNDLPLNGYRSIMTCPRELSFGKYDGNCILVQKPVREVYDRYASHFSTHLLSAEENIYSFSGLELTFNAEQSIVAVHRNDNSIGHNYASDLRIALEKRNQHDMTVINDEYSVEIFIDGGAVCITMLVL